MDVSSTLQVTVLSVCNASLLWQVVEVVAFASVHDMIHAAIASYGKQATLREVRPISASPTCFCTSVVTLCKTCCNVCRSTEHVSRGDVLHISDQEGHASSHTMTTGRARSATLCTPVTDLPGDQPLACPPSATNFLSGLHARHEHHTKVLSGAPGQLMHMTCGRCQRPSANSSLKPPRF